MFAMPAESAESTMPAEFAMPSEPSHAIEPSSRFVQNRSCEFFPCHDGVDEGRFNCLFCYCPLYALGPACGGDFRLAASGVKDCTPCTLLHDGDGGADVVRARFPEFAALARGGEGEGEGAPAPAGDGGGGAR